MCEKQETFGEWSVSVGRENVKVSNGVSNGKVMER